MREDDIAEKLKEAFSNTTPDVLGGVYSRVDKLPQRRKTAEKRRKRFSAGLIAAAAVFAAVLLAAGMLIGSRIPKKDNEKDVFASLFIDVNPSLEIRIGRNERVIEVIPLNEDAKTVIGDMDFGGASLELAVNAIIGSMYRTGFLNETENSVLVSLDNAEAEGARELLDRVSREINDILEQSGGGRVIKQTEEPDPNAYSIAYRYNMSVGKAALVNELLMLDPSFNGMDFSGISVTSLENLVENCRSCLDDPEYDPLERALDPGSADLFEVLYSVLESQKLDHHGIVFVKGEYLDGVWYITTNASHGGTPDINVRSALMNGYECRYVEFSIGAVKLKISVSGRDGSININEYSCGVDDCEYVDWPHLNSYTQEWYAGFDSAAVKAIYARGADRSSVEGPITVELVRDAEPPYYIVRFISGGTDYEVLTYAETGDVISPAG